MLSFEVTKIMLDGGASEHVDVELLWENGGCPGARRAARSGNGGVYRWSVRDLKPDGIQRNDQRKDTFKNGQVGAPRGPRESRKCMWKS